MLSNMLKEFMVVFVFFFRHWNFAVIMQWKKRYNLTYLNHCTMTNLRDWNINEDMLISVALSVYFDYEPCS